MKALRWRWSGVIHKLTCRVIGHRWGGTDTSEPWCERCWWIPAENPNPPKLVANYGRGWLSLMPGVPRKGQRW